MRVPPGIKLWDSIMWSRNWDLWATTHGFSAHQRVVIHWIVDHAEKWDVPHAHDFIAVGANVSRSTVTKTMRKLKDIGAVQQLGQQHFRLVPPPKASGGTHLDPPNASRGTHNRERGDANLKLKYGKELQDYVFCRKCLRADVPLQHVGEKYEKQLKRDIPLFECIYPEDCNG